MTALSKHRTPRSGQEVIALLTEKARLIRLETMRLVGIAKSGHYSSVFSCAELLATLYYHVLRVDPTRPDWSERDRFILSKGHAAVGLYPVLADLGFFPWSDLDNYTRVGSPFADHPRLDIPGIDFSSGSLGHGLSIAAGMAHAGRADGLNYRVHCMLGDAELNEGLIWEAAMAAVHLRLGNLVATIDCNQMGLDGFTAEVMGVEPLVEKWRAFGWRVFDVKGHDVGELVKVYDSLQLCTDGQPTVIIARTIKGKGIPWMELSRVWHLGALVGEDLEEATRELGVGSA